MSTDAKLKGDIAEQAAVLSAIKRGWDVLQPIEDKASSGLRAIKYQEGQTKTASSHGSSRHQRFFFVRITVYF